MTTRLSSSILCVVSLCEIIVLHLFLTSDHSWEQLEPAVQIHWQVKGFKGALLPRLDFLVFLEQVKRNSLLA